MNRIEAEMIVDLAVKNFVSAKLVVINAALDNPESSAALATLACKDLQNAIKLRNEWVKRDIEPNFSISAFVQSLMFTNAATLERGLLKVPAEDVIQAYMQN